MGEEAVPPTAPSRVAYPHEGVHSLPAIAPGLFSVHHIPRWRLPSPLRFSPFPSLGPALAYCPSVTNNNHSHSQSTIAFLQRMRVFLVQFLHLFLHLLQIGILSLQEKLFIRRLRRIQPPNPQPHFGESILATQVKRRSRSQNPLPASAKELTTCLLYHTIHPTVNLRASPLHHSTP